MHSLLSFVGNEHYSSILREAKQRVEHSPQKDLPFSSLEAADTPMDESLTAVRGKSSLLS